MKTIDVRIEYDEKKCSISLRPDVIEFAFNYGYQRAYCADLNATIRELPEQSEEGHGEVRCSNCKTDVNVCGGWKENCRYFQPKEQEKKSCKNCGNSKCSYSVFWEVGSKILAGEIPCIDWQSIPSKVDDDLSKLLADCAECLDDCLIRIYPEEFDQKSIDEASKRFTQKRGTISRIATLVERIKSVPAKIDDDSCGSGLKYGTKDELPKVLVK